MTSQHDRRLSPRLQIQIAVGLLPSGDHVPRLAQSANVSSSGVLIESDQELQPGSTVYLWLTLTPALTRGERNMFLRAIGTITRVENAGGRRQLAVHVDEWLPLSAGNRKPVQREP